MAKKKTDTEATAPETETKPEAAATETPKPRKAKAEKPAAEAPAAAPEAAPADAAKPAEPTAPIGLEPAKKRSKAAGTAPRRGKKLRTKLANAAAELKKTGTVDFKQAVALLKKHKRSKMDETVEVHMWLGIDPKQSDQAVRGAVPLPHGVGKTVKLLVFTQGDKAAQAKAAGAEHVGGDELAKKITTENWTDFDVALATPDMMGIVGKLGKVLGPRGLMPSPKAGTVVTGDIAAAVKEFKAGKVEFRADAGGCIHGRVGKMSFDDSKLVENINAFVEAVRLAKPSAAKGDYIRSITVSATMSPGIRITL